MEINQRGIQLQTACMPLLLCILLLLVLSCQNTIDFTSNTHFNLPKQKPESVRVTDSSSWAFFLQHLPETKGEVVDYKKNKVQDQDKAFTVVNYDVGTRDLQQCADALIRLRAEYLFKLQRFNEISFHFTNGAAYSFLDYCRGRKPVQQGRDVAFVTTQPQPNNHTSLRRYLDIVYTYAGTISLAKELKPASEFAIGTVVISPGSPGHCFIIIDQATKPDGQLVYKLAEGYTPAQSIYVLRNTAEPELGCWHRLAKNKIETASYTFNRFALKRFE